MIRIKSINGRFLSFVICLVVAMVPFVILFAQENVQDITSDEIKKLAETFVKELLSRNNAQNSVIFNDSVLVRFKKVLDQAEKSFRDSLEEWEYFSRADILGVAFVNKNNARVFIEEHKTNGSDEITFTDFSDKVSANAYFKEREAVEEVARRLLANFQKKPDHENYQLLSDSMIAGYKDVGIYDARSYADSFKAVVMNRLSQVLGTAFAHKDSARVFVEEIREDGVKYTTFINFVRQRSGWKFDGYDARYICPY